jgi:hypothetical protein
MTSSPLARLAGPTAIVAAALVVLTRIVSLLNIPHDAEALKAYVVQPTHGITSVVSIVAFALLIVALVAAYGRYAQTMGTLGAIGVGAAVIGTVFMAGDWWYEAFSVPWMADIAPAAFETGPAGRLLMGGLASFGLFAAGWTLFGLASLRAGALPPAISATIVLGGIASGLPFGAVYLYGNILLGLGIGWLGYSIMTASEDSAPTAVAVHPRESF